MERKNYIIGAGVTGVSAGMTSGCTIFEASDGPGGICRSYYIPSAGGSYRFENGGGHWIFGGDPVVLSMLSDLSPMKSYVRKAAVHFHETDKYIPYPIQNFLHCLGPVTAERVLKQIVSLQTSGKSKQFSTMNEWLEASFGELLTSLFFEPFHRLYTAGLSKLIAPQDAYKSPIDLNAIIAGAFDNGTVNANSVGYNPTFLYPENGLDHLTNAMAEKCDIKYGYKLTYIDTERKLLGFENGEVIPYNKVLCTLPLDKLLKLSSLEFCDDPDPYTSVLVANIGAQKGANCPEYHWLYNSLTETKFHRVGFYSNVDSSFVPNHRDDLVSIYVEKAYLPTAKPTQSEIDEYAKELVYELQYWGFIKNVDVIDMSWVEHAYTWSYPGSKWKQKALNSLQSHSIYPIGRYGRWIFQGITDSVRDGMYAGGCIK